VCEEERARAGSSLQDDLQLLKKPHLLSPRSLLAAQFRAEKKGVLAACTSWCEKRLAKARPALQASGASSEPRKEPLTR
jgi:hypothetical protein